MRRHVLAIPKGEWLLQSAAGSELGPMIIRLARHDGICTTKYRATTRIGRWTGTFGGRRRYDHVATSPESHEHARIAEALGYRRAFWASGLVVQSASLGSRSPGLRHPSGMPCSPKPSKPPNSSGMTIRSARAF